MVKKDLDAEQETIVIDSSGSDVDQPNVVTEAASSTPSKKKSKKKRKKKAKLDKKTDEQGEKREKLSSPKSVPTTPKKKGPTKAKKFKPSKHRHDPTPDDDDDSDSQKPKWSVKRRIFMEDDDSSTE